MEPWSGGGGCLPATGAPGELTKLPSPGAAFQHLWLLLSLRCSVPCALYKNWHQGLGGTRCCAVLLLGSKPSHYCRSDPRPLLWSCSSYKWQVPFKHTVTAPRALSNDCTRVASCMTRREESETLQGDGEFRLKNLALPSCRTKRWDIKEPGPQV